MLVGFCRWPAAGAAHKLLLLLHLFTDLRVSTELHTAFKYEHIFGKQLPWYKILTDVWNSYNRYVEDFFFFQGVLDGQDVSCLIAWRSCLTIYNVVPQILKSRHLLKKLKMLTFK